MSQALHHEAVFQRPLVEVFELITTTGCWPQWHPATHAVSGQTLRPAQLGDECTEAMRTAGFFEGHISWRVVACETPVRWAIASTEIAVPLLSRAKVRVEYALEAERGGTRLFRCFDYELPRHLWLLDRLYFHAKMESESVEALRRLVPLVDRTRVAA
ncbi:MAG: SRPBCC family protein [Deltaproteobacteria bacterium]|nr:SRPBCC family protein [Deltaproteobacteria bacterium]